MANESYVRSSVCVHIINFYWLTALVALSDKGSNSWIPNKDVVQ